MSWKQVLKHNFCDEAKNAMFSARFMGFGSEGRAARLFQTNTTGTILNGELTVKPQFFQVKTDEMTIHILKIPSYLLRHSGVKQLQVLRRSLNFFFTFLLIFFLSGFFLWVEHYLLWFWLLTSESVRNVHPRAETRRQWLCLKPQCAHIGGAASVSEVTTRDDVTIRPAAPATCEFVGVSDNRLVSRIETNAYSERQGGTRSCPVPPFWNWCFCALWSCTSIFVVRVCRRGSEPRPPRNAAKWMSTWMSLLSVLLWSRSWISPLHNGYKASRFNSCTTTVVLVPKFYSATVKGLFAQGNANFLPHDDDLDPGDPSTPLRKIHTRQVCVACCTFSKSLSPPPRNIWSVSPGPNLGSTSISPHGWSSSVDGGSKGCEPRKGDNASTCNLREKLYYNSRVKYLSKLTRKHLLD